MKCAGLIFDDSFHYIDHLAPFCSLLNWPLIVCEPFIEEACRRFYPSLEVFRADLFDLKNHFPSWLVTCDNRTLLDCAIGPWIDRPYKTMWLPHGLSDKGHKGSFFEALGKEDLALVYGQKMSSTLLAKGIQIPQVVVGDFRRRYFEKHRSFYEALFVKERFILYAPTWEDMEENGIFWNALPKLIAHLPSHLSLGIKFHPNTEKTHLPQLEKWKGMYAKKNLFFIDQFPPIYPILDRADVYVGDMSSIGYDFLFFDRPLIFLRKEKTDPTIDPSAFLMRCGEQLLLDQLSSLGALCDQPSKQKMRQETLAFSFDSVDNLQEKVLLAIQ